MKPPAPIIPTNNIRVRRPQQKRQDPRIQPTQQPYQSPNLSGGQVGNQILPPASPTANKPVGQAPAPIQERGGTASGVTNTAPAPAAFDPNDPTQTDNAAMKAIYDLLTQGPRNTSADEKQVMDQLNAQTGQGQADLNARMGAAGFGTSGALGAASGDMRRQNTLAAGDKITGLRKDARDEYLNRVMAGIEGELKDRGMDMSEEQYQAYLNMIMAMNGGAGGSGGAGTNGEPIYGSPETTGQNTAYDGLTPEEAAAKNEHNQATQTQDRFDSQGGQNMVNSNSVPEVSSVPSGGQFVGDKDGYAYYFIPGPGGDRAGGKYVRVKHS